MQDASAYREKVINEAQGKAQQFTSVYNEYKNAKDVTTKRLYFETMEHILKGAKKFVVTGTLPMGRDEVKDLIEAHGGQVMSSVSKKTDFVLAGMICPLNKNKDA